MPKGMFSAGMVVLTDREVPVEEIQRALSPKFEVAKAKPPEPDRNWMGGGPTVVLAYRREVNGVVIVDSVDKPWPDTMGDPKTDMNLFGGWSMGFFGPFTFPGNLARAKQQSYVSEKAPDAAERHTSFLRIRCSYVMGEVPDTTPVQPNDYDPLHELRYVTKVARTLLRIPGALAYFNPNGEVLTTPEDFERMMTDTAAELPPLPLWANIRMFRADDVPGWMMMDTVGMGQLDAIDHEACFTLERGDPSEVAGMLRNVSYYTYQQGDVIKDDHTIDGPGGKWRASHHEQPILDPPRDTIRWFPPGVTVPGFFRTHGKPKSQGFLGKVKSLFRR